MPYAKGLCVKDNVKGWDKTQKIAENPFIRL